MQTFTFKYDPSVKTLKGLTDKLKRAVETGESHVQERNEMRSGSIKALLEIATENRINLFMTIVQKQPQSVNELANWVGRDQSYVSKELKILEGLGLIKIVKPDGSKSVPVALFNHIVIDIGIDSKSKVS